MYPNKLRTGLANIKITLAYAVLSTITSYLWVYSTLHAPLGISLTLLFLSPIWVVLYEWLVEKQKQLGTLLSAITAFIGTVCITNSYQNEGAYGYFGIAAALINSFVFSTALIVGRRAKNRVSPEALAFWTLILITLCFGWSIPQAKWSTGSLINALGIGIVGSGLVHLCTTKALKLIAASEVSVLMYFEVALGWVVGYLLYQEPVKFLAVLGTCLVFLSVVIVWLKTPKVSPP